MGRAGHGARGTEHVTDTPKATNAAAGGQTDDGQAATAGVSQWERTRQGKGGPTRAALALADSGARHRDDWPASWADEMHMRLSTAGQQSAQSTNAWLWVAKVALGGCWVKAQRQQLTLVGGRSSERLRGGMARVNHGALHIAADGGESGLEWAWWWAWWAW